MAELVTFGRDLKPSNGGNLFQWLITLPVKDLCLISTFNLYSFNFWPLGLVDVKNLMLSVVNIMHGVSLS